MWALPLGYESDPDSPPDSPDSPPVSPQGAAEMDTGRPPLKDRAMMAVASAARAGGMKGMVSEAEMVRMGLKWWLRSMAGGWMGQWIEQFTTEDLEVLDYNSATPIYVSGQAGACRFYNALMSCHSPRDIQLDIDIGDPEVLEPQKVFVQATLSLDWGHPYQYRLETNVEITLRDGLMARLLFWGVKSEKPVGPCGIVPIGQLEGHWRALLAPHRLLDQPPALLPSPEEEIAGMEEFLKMMVTQWESAISDPEWTTRWGGICFTEDFTLVDHTTAPRSLKAVGREAAKHYYLRQIEMDIAAGGGRSTRRWETTGWEMDPGPPATLVLKAKVTWRWPEGDYCLPLRVEGRARGMRCDVLELRPQDLPVQAGGRRAEDAVSWSPGDELDPGLWRQWAKESTAVHINKPCGHNSWDNVRIRRGWVVLRCRECDAKWRQRPHSNERCPDFPTPQGCARGDACPQLHVHHTKRTAEERAQGPTVCHADTTPVKEEPSASAASHPRG
eukprot:Hpha_TRINITY_DN15090_c5_g3::TRINITY_DN15090_c5_g3_i3::g.123401::m.123401